MFKFLTSKTSRVLCVAVASTAVANLARAQDRGHTNFNTPTYLLAKTQPVTVFASTETQTGCVPDGTGCVPDGPTSAPVPVTSAPVPVAFGGLNASNGNGVEGVPEATGCVPEGIERVRRLPAMAVAYGMPVHAWQDSTAQRTASNAKKNEAAGSKNQSQNFLPPQLPISGISINVRAKSEKGNDTLPHSQAVDALGAIPQVPSAPAISWTEGMLLTSQATVGEVPYQPLYFEEVNLERYGRTAGLAQPAVSAVRFYGTIPLLPYAMTNHPPGRAYYWHWPYPAGWAAPPVREFQPLNPKAAAAQAGATTGMFFLLP